MPPLNILIIGASIAGPALASFLLLSPVEASQKPAVTILERAPAPRSEGQNIDIRGTGIAILRKLGIEGEVRKHLTGEAGVQWVDAQNRVKAQMDAAEDGPTAELEITRGRLAQVLIKRTEEISRTVEKHGGRGIEWIFGDYADSIAQDGDAVQVHLAKNDVTRSFDLVVAADGLQSTTRKMAWGAEGEGHRLHKLGLYGGFWSMPPERTDNGYRRWLHAPGRRGAMIRPDQSSGRSTVFMYVMSDTDNRFSDVAVGRTAVEKQKALLAEYFSNVGWESERLLREMWATDDFYYDMVAQVKMDQWSKGRIVLLGDAAYCASPLSGMGTTLALNGAYNLAGQISQTPGDFTTAFARYEAKMRPIVVTAQKLAPGIPGLLFGINSAWGVYVLNTVVAVLLWMGPLIKRIFGTFGPPAPKVVLDDFGFVGMD